MSLFTGPEPPNPQTTASQQTNANVSTAIANAFLNNVNQVTPSGYLQYEPTSSYSWTDPSTGQTYNIPRFTATQTFGQTQQAAFNATEAAKINLANLGQTQSAKLNELLGTNIDLGGAPAFGDPSGLSGFDPQKSYGPDDFSKDRANVEKALFQRVQPQLDLQQNRLEQKLADQGLRPGSPAYAAAYDEFNRQANDLRLAITDQAGQEQQRLIQQAAARGQFANAAQAQAYQQAVTQMNARNAARQQFLAEAYQARALPINEVTALLSGSQVSQPNWINAPQTQIPTTDIAGIINANFNQQLQQQKIQSELVGNIIGAGGKLGSAALSASDRRIKDDIHRIGTVFAADPEGGTHDLPIHTYTYKADPTDTPHVGPMAQDVERIDPRAVTHDRRGVKYIRKPRLMGAILRAA